jgi:hypothetical protein
MGSLGVLTTYTRCVYPTRASSEYPGQPSVRTVEPASTFRVRQSRIFTAPALSTVESRSLPARSQRVSYLFSQARSDVVFRETP